MNEKGLTLIEILAALVILSVVSILAMNILFSSQKTYSNQQIKNFTVAETTLFFNELLTDVRMHPTGISVTNNIVTIPSANPSIVYSYDASTSTVQKNSRAILNNVSTYEARLTNGQLIVKIFDAAGKEYETIVTLRSGG